MLDFRQWGDLIKETVWRKREEFGCISLSSLASLSSGRMQRRSRSTGNLLDDSSEDAGLDYKPCLIQGDEEEEDRLEHFNTEFQQRMVLSNSNNEHLGRYKIHY